MTSTGLGSVTSARLDSVTSAGLDSVTSAGLGSVTSAGLDSVTSIGLGSVTSEYLENMLLYAFIVVFKVAHPCNILLFKVVFWNHTETSLLATYYHTGCDVPVSS